MVKTGRMRVMKPKNQKKIKSGSEWLLKCPELNSGHSDRRLLCSAKKKYMQGHEACVGADWAVSLR